jgi:hypothetical protein
MPPLLTRRRFLLASTLGVVGAGGYGLTRAVHRVRDAARRLTDE